MAKTPYTKPPKSIQDQISLLLSRGLIINDTLRAGRYLSNISYYRLSAYFIPYEVTGYGIKPRNHNFIGNTSFDDILNLYIFDRKLKILVMEAIERIEISVRSQWSLNITNNGDAHAYTDINNFRDLIRNNGSILHSDLITKLCREINISKETFVLHYNENYDPPPLPPTWAIVELLSFGSLSKWYQITKDSNTKLNIARSFGLPKYQTLVSVMQVLTLVRNICAHHGRLWNRRIVKALPIIHSMQSQLIMEQFTASDGTHQIQPSKNIYNILIILVNMLRKINPDTTWPQRLKNHILTLDANHQAAMGCPPDFETKLPWQIPTGANP